jgi:hypothetical protein
MYVSFFVLVVVPQTWSSVRSSLILLSMNWTVDDAVIFLVDWNDMTSPLFE